VGQLYPAKGIARQSDDFCDKAVERFPLNLLLERTGLPMYCSILSSAFNYVSYLDRDTNKAPQRQSLCGSLKEIIPSMTTQRDKLREDVKFRILRLLQDNPEMSQRDLAKAVGVSTGGINYVLAALVEKGMLKLSNFTAAEDRRRYAYVLTPKGITVKADLTRRFMIRKLAEYAALKAEIEEVWCDLSDQELAEIRAELKTGN
jgi:EPS-associated MarR family transcriptional regulator